MGCEHSGAGYRIGRVLEGLCPLCCVPLDRHDDHGDCPCCGGGFSGDNAEVRLHMHFDFPG